LNSAIYPSGVVKKINMVEKVKTNIILTFSTKKLEFTTLCTIKFEEIPDIQDLEAIPKNDRLL